MKTRGKEGKDLTIRTLYLPALIVAGVLMACATAVLAVSREVEATFPGKNGKIAYVAFRVTNGTAEVYTINLGGEGKTQITHNNTDEFSLSYSPNGKKIVFVSGYVNEELYTIDASGGGKTQITNNNKADFDPSYSPNSKKIVYEGSDTFGDLNVDKAESDIYTIKAGGGDKTHVTNTDNMDEFEPSYSPDGKKIAYTVYKGNASELYIIDVGGGGKTKLTNTDKVDEYMPSWGSRP